MTGYSTECSGHPIGQGSTLDAQITGVDGPSGQSVPADAQAVVVNVTAIGGTHSTYLTVFPAGTAPPNASNLNVTAGLNQANLVVVALGTGGQIGIYNSAGTINVAVDVEGYFAAASGDVPGLFHPIAPLRICDTRSTAVTGYSTECSGATLGQGQWEKVVVSGCPTGDPSCSASVPTSDAASVALNLTGVTGTANTFLSVVPPSGSDQCPSSAPGFSNLNINGGTNLPNRVIVPLGPDQDVCVYNSAGAINFILDVNGWFGNGSESSPGASFDAISPTRICDTRPTSVTGYGTECSGHALGQGGTLTVPVAGVDGIPAGNPVAMIANVTAVSGTSFTYFTLYPSDVTQPNASDLNVGPGQITPNLVIVQLATTGGQAGNANLFNASGSINAIVDVSGYFIPASPAPVTITTTSIPSSATVGIRYATTALSAYGGTPPYTWQVSSGSLPSGLTLSTAGVISGTPTAADPFSFSVEVTDSTTPTTETATLALLITVHLAPPGTIYSPNWSGYVLESGPYSEATGTFLVPSLYAGQEDTDMSEWVGIDGFSNTDLIQAGIEEYPDPLNSSYFYILPWWEILPAAETPITTLTVVPGDTVTVTIEQVSGTTWQILLADETTEASFSTDQTYTGPGTSAEWIVEAPERGGEISTLAAYTTTMFDGLGMTGAQNVLTKSIMVQDGFQVSTPSAFTASGFDVAYGGVAPPPP